MKWTKQTELTSSEEQLNEVWMREGDGKTDRYPMDVYLGKKTDLVALKKNVLSNLSEQVKQFRSSRTHMYSQPEMRDVLLCPVCGTSSSQTTEKVKIYGANYSQCNTCTHVYLKQTPSEGAISQFYLSDVNYASTYTDRTAAESRLNAIAVPWTDWVINVYQKIYGTAPASVIDVGSGAGHFVEACRRRGMRSHGVELSESSRKFARDIWGIELDGRDFMDVADEYEPVDLVTFWGLLEHTPNPGAILDAAHRILRRGKKGLVIAKIPRWNSVSSSVQTNFCDSVIRHLDPMGHIMCFTDASASELYVRHGFDPRAAWYYGMDSYELMVQLSNAMKNEDLYRSTGILQGILQERFDEGRLSDGLVLVGIPRK